jgi:hypothetical protein
MSSRLPGKATGQGCRARLPGKASGQGCRARLPGKAAGQGCRARLPGKAAGQGCRARLPGKAAGQGCRARLPGKAAGQGCRAMLPDKASNADMTACLPLQDCIVQTTRLPAYGRKFLPPRCSPATRLPAYGRIISRRCSGSFSNCIQALCSHLQWQDTKLHARGGCCPAAVAGYQTATCSGRIPNYMHAPAVDLLQRQDTKLLH